MKDYKDLAIFSGVPSFKEILHVGRPNIGSKEEYIDKIRIMMERNWLTNNGPFVRELEDKIKKYLDVKYCICVCNATIGLELAIKALELKGEVIVPSFTFVATAHALHWQGIKPVFCDIRRETHNINPDLLVNLITPNTTGIMAVHTWGRPCDVRQIESIAKKSHIKVLYDAAHAFGCSLDNMMIGNFGDAEVFSFHATKFFNSCEGGAVVTNNEELAKIIRLMKNFGFSGYDKVTHLGTNGKMTEACAAMGLTNFDHIDSIIKRNRSNYELYKQRIEKIEGLKIITYNENNNNNYHYIIIEVDKNITSISRDQIVKILHHENVLARKYFFPGCHRMEPYKTDYPNTGLSLPETEELADICFSLPNGMTLTNHQIENVCDIIECSVHNGYKLSQLLT